MCVCVFSLSKQCWKACLKTSQRIQSYGLWTCRIRIRVVLVLTLMVLLQSSLSFLNLYCDPSPKNFPPTSGCGWSGGRKSGPDASRSTRTSGRKRWSLVCYKWCRVVDIVGIWWYMLVCFKGCEMCKIQAMWIFISWSTLHGSRRGYGASVICKILQA